MSNLSQLCLHTPTGSLPTRSLASDHPATRPRDRAAAGRLLVLLAQLRGGGGSVDRGQGCKPWLQPSGDIPATRDEGRRRSFRLLAKIAAPEAREVKEGRVFGAAFRVGHTVDRRPRVVQMPHIE